MLMETLNGTLLRGYEVLDVIGQGGFSAVYRAMQPTIEREVAIKVILPLYANEADFIRRFETEAQLVARLEHPHIVPLFDYWRDPNGAYLVMRYLRGGSLRQYIDAHEHIPLENLTRIVEQVASALAMAHRHGIIHRDLKPENVLMDEDGNAYLSDFGIAVTTTEVNHAIEGTLLYMAPEQLRGQPPSIQSDIYSFGVMLYQMLTGRPPFYAPTVNELINKQLHSPLPPLQQDRSDLPPGLNTIIQRATQKSVDKRYSNAIEIADAFRRAITPEVTPNPNISSLSAPVNPYKGLRSFSEPDAQDFFGRELLCNRFIRHLRQHNFLAVVGPSGSGKSSAIFAGLMPALRRGALDGSQTWYYAEMVPGEDPLSHLEAALLSVADHPPDNLLESLLTEPLNLASVIGEVLGDAAENLILVIDQFEEVFTTLQGESERAHFLELIGAAVTAPYSRLKLVIALRADFMDRPLNYARFGELIQQHTEFVLPMSAEELERAIVGPATRNGLQVDHDLIAAIVADVNAEPGALPLLQYTLTEVFHRREGVVLTLAGYHATGGVLGALAQRAEEVYQALSPKHQIIARQIFLRLVTQNDDMDDTRRRVSLAELHAITLRRSANDDAPENTSNAEDIQAVLRAFDQARLLTFDNDPATRMPMVEVAHEALLREWSSLREWLAESRHDIRQQRWLAGAASEWMRAQKNPDYLLMGSRLNQYEEWVNKTDVALTPLERRFLNTSLSKRQELLDAEHERRQRESKLERRANKNMQSVIWILLLTVVLISFLLVTVYMQAKNARHERNEARLARQTSEANANLAGTQAVIAEKRASELASLSLIDGANQALREANGDLALRLAIEANQAKDVPDLVRQALYTMAYIPATRWYLPTSEQIPAFVAIPSPDGQLLAYAGGRQTPFAPAQDAFVIIWDIEKQSIRHTLQGHHDSILDAVFSPDSRWLVTGGYDGQILMWDVETGELIRRLEGNLEMACTVEVSHDGRYILAGVGNFLQGFLFKTTPKDSRVLIWDAETGELLREFDGHQKGVLSLDISPDDRQVLSGSTEGDLLLWDFENGEILHRFPDLEGWTTGASFSPDGRYIASSSGNPALLGDSPAEFDYRVMVWERESLELRYRLSEFDDFVISLAFSPDSQHLLTGSADFWLSEWNLATGELEQRLGGHRHFVFDVNYLTDGQAAVTASHDGTVRIWNLRYGIEEREIQAHTGPVLGIAPAGDERVVSVGTDGQVLLWDGATGELIRRYTGQTQRLGAVDVSPDGRWLAAGGDAQVLWVWDLKTGELLHRLSGHEGSISFIQFSPDGQQLFSGSSTLQSDRSSASLRVWDAQTGALVHQYTGFSNPIASVHLSHDEKTLIVGFRIGFLDTNSSHVQVWDYPSGKLRMTWPAQHSGRLTTALSSDDRLLVIGEEGGGLRVIDMQKQEEVQQIGQTDAIMTQVYFSADNQRLIASLTDGTIRVWDLATGRELRRLSNTNQSPIQASYLSPDERRVIFGSDDGTIRIWYLHEMDELWEWIGKHRYVRDFTCAERVHYRLEPLCDGVSGADDLK